MKANVTSIFDDICKSLGLVVYLLDCLMPILRFTQVLHLKIQFLIIHINTSWMHLRWPILIYHYNLAIQFFGEREGSLFNVYLIASTLFPIISFILFHFIVIFLNFGRSDKAGKMLAEEVLEKGLQGQR